MKKIDWNFQFLKKFPKKNQWVIMLLVGILLVVIALPTSKGEKTTAEETAASGGSKVSSDEYEAKAEQKLAKILGNVEGVGNVKVMITLKESSEKVVEKDIDKSSRSDETTNGDGTSKTIESSSNETTIYNEQNNSGQTPYVSKEISPAVEGVLVIADGGDNPVVVQNITEAIQALFNVDMHKIKVMKRNQEN